MEKIICGKFAEFFSVFILLPKKQVMAVRSGFFFFIIKTEKNS